MKRYRHNKRFYAPRFLGRRTGAADGPDDESRRRSGAGEQDHEKTRTRAGIAGHGLPPGPAAARAAGRVFEGRGPPAVAADSGSPTAEIASTMTETPTAVLAYDSARVARRTLPASTAVAAPWLQRQ